MLYFNSKGDQIKNIKIDLFKNQNQNNKSDFYDYYTSKKNLSKIIKPDNKKVTEKNIDKMRVY